MLLTNLVAVGGSISRRTQAHFLASIKRKLRTVRHLSRAEAARAVQVVTLEAQRAERQKLLRMVMHDMRSPLLSVINISAALLELGAAAAPSANSAAHAADCRLLAYAPRISDTSVVESLQGLATCATLMERIVSDMLGASRASGASAPARAVAPSPGALAHQTRRHCARRPPCPCRRVAPSLAPEHFAACARRL
jgi:signal transduction histidine kinase